ncbi:MAG: cysteine desulfurase family protein [Bacteroidales bacterium]
MNCQPDEIVFTSGGTESNNYAIKGIALANRNKGNHIITTQIEHPAVIEVCKNLEENGFEVTYLPVDSSGMVKISDIEKSIKPETILITIMHANNEVGTIQPVEEIARVAKEREVIFHTDAAQSVGKIPTDVNLLGIDLLSIAGHKLYAPQGIGAIYIRRGVKLAKLIHGASHEQGRRAGTENVLGIVGLGKACEIAKRDMQKNILHMKGMRDRLY